MSDNLSDVDKHFGDIIPEGGIGTIGIRIVQFLGSDGEMHWQYDFSGEALVSQVVSLLEFVKVDFTVQYINHMRRNEG